MYAKLKFIYGLVKQVLAFLREVEADAQTRLSDQSAHRDRLRIEAYLYDLTAGNEKGWRSLTKADDALLRYFQILMKSSKLLEIHKTTNDSEVEKAMIAFTSVRDIGPER